MAFPNEDLFQQQQKQQQEHSSSKLFTEYSLSAILTIVGLIGSFMTILSLSTVVIFAYLIIIMTSTTLDLILIITLICSVAMIPLGGYQAYQAYQLHKESIHNFKRMQIIASFNVILSIVQAAAYASILFIIGLIMIYAFSGVIVFNLIVIYFLNQSEIRQEFEG